LEKPEYAAKELIPPKKGPTLLKQEAVAVKFDSKPKGSHETRRNIAKKHSIYSIKYADALLRVASSTSLPSNEIEETERG